MKSLSILVVSVLCFVLFSSDGVSAETDNCVECHKKTAFRVTHVRLYKYYEEWNGSAHE